MDLVLHALVVCLAVQGLSTSVNGHSEMGSKISRPCLMSEGNFLCRDDSACVNIEHVCDAKVNCLDGSDNGGKCMEKCPRNVFCSYKCHSSPDGPICICPSGQVLLKDNRTCADLDECTLWPPMCSQKCLNTFGSYTCSCDEGYVLDDDLVHCFAKSRKAFLIYNQGPSIIKVDIDRDTYSRPLAVHHALGGVTAMTWDASEERLFFYDSGENSINSVIIESDHPPNSVENVITNGLSMVSSLSYDSSSGNLYVADIGLHELMVCSMRTRMCLTIVQLSLMQMPRSLAVDSQNGKLYWSECSGSRRISSSALDGSQRKVLVRDGIRCATSLVIDLPTDTLYWTDAELHLVESIKTDGTNRRNVTSSMIVHPLGITIFEEDLYWTSSDIITETSLIAVSNKFSPSSRTTHNVIASLHDVPTEIHFCHPVLQPTGESPCSLYACSDICLPVSFAGRSFKCACPKGSELDSSQRNCMKSWRVPSLLVAGNNHLVRVIPDVVGGHVHEMFLVNGESSISSLALDWSSQTLFIADFVERTSSDGSKRFATMASLSLTDPASIVTLFSDVALVTGISVDWISHNVYWTDYEKNVIEVARMDGASRKIIVYGLDKPRAIAVDPFQSSFYYSECGARRHIGRCDLGGRACHEDVFKVSVGCVVDMKLDSRQGRLYWSDSERSLISSADVNSGLVTAIRHSLSPLSLAITADRIFWTDSHSEQIFYHEKDISEHKEHIKMAVSNLGALVSVDSYTQPKGDSGCASRNGGCSHLCISTNNMQHYCACPQDMQLDDDLVTCLGRKVLEPITPPSRWIQSTIVNQRSPGLKVPSRKQRTSTTSPLSVTKSFTSVCPDDYCLNGGICMIIQDTFMCRCYDDWVGTRCELMAPVELPHSVHPSTSSSTGWVLTLLGVVVVIAIVVAIACFIKARRNLHPGEAFRLAHLNPLIILGVKGGDKDDNKESLIHRPRDGKIKLHDDECPSQQMSLQVCTNCLDSMNPATASDNHRMFSEMPSGV